MSVQPVLQPIGEGGLLLSLIGRLVNRDAPQRRPVLDGFVLNGWNEGVARPVGVRRGQDEVRAMREGLESSPGAELLPADQDGRPVVTNADRRWIPQHE